MMVSVLKAAGAGRYRAGVTLISPLLPKSEER